MDNLLLITAVFIVLGGIGYSLYDTLNLFMQKERRI